MRHLRIGTQLALWVGVVSALAVGALVFVMIRSTDRAFDAKIHEDLDHVARLSAGEVDALAEALDSAADHAADVLTSRLAGTFELDAEATVEIAGKPTPRLTRDGQPLNLDLGAVDAFTRDTGAVATVFARSGDDFVRVTTSLQKEDGSRAVGTPLGEAHPARAELLAGKPFAGPAVLFGRFYLTRYRPVRDAANRVVGALFVGLDCTRQRDAILARLGQVRLGERGFVWIVDGRAGPNRGRVLLHPTFAGKNATQPGDQVPEYVRSVLASQPGPLEFDAGADLRTTSIADVAGWGWRVVADASRNETEMASRRVARTVGALGVAVVVAFSATSGWFIRRRLRPLEGIVSAAHRIGEGDLTTPVAYARQDEIGELAGAMNAAMSSISEMVDGIHRRTAGLGHASDSAAETSARMTSGADRVAELAQRVAASADQGSSNIHSVAAAVEEMGASIQEIAKNAAEAAAVASEASTAARGAAEKIASLDQLSTEIGNVVKLVTSIAEQTNLLALNATIEAARAGEAGKGFAVVANEVKTLASATANATGEISKTIDAIQAGTSGSVRTIGEIGTIVERVTELQSAIAAAVEEQTSVTREISMNVASAAEASREISAEVGGVADAAASTSSGAQETARSAAEVREVNQELTRLVKRFRTGAAASAVPSFGAASVR